MVDGLTPAQHATRTIRERQAAQLAAAAAAEADRALARAENARGMVLHDRPTLASLDERMGAVERLGAVPGPPGKPGEPGPPGRPGVDSVVPGPQGEPGARGATGAAGRDGSAGAPGADGKDGAQGVNGKDGAPGAAGTAGAAGATGATGPAGKDGATGAGGAPGGTGPAGATGATGPAGPSSGTWQIVEGLTVPPMLSLLGGASTVDVPVTWPAPFPDAGYVVTATVIPAAATLLGRTGATLKAGTRTATGCTVTVTTTAILAAGQATLTVRADRKA